jgi:DNA-binding NarL/FixJ family response regulator
VSETTVMTHVGNRLTKLSLRDRPGATERSLRDADAGYREAG